jgi:PIN domain nuclease of toxin-antitoxin system
MRFLLDTHVFIWWDAESAELSPTARALCKDSANTMLLSVASVWEMQIKVQLGKMNLRLPLADIIDGQCRENGLEILSITIPHILELPNLPLIKDHKDPFDRMIIAQAVVESLPLMSGDANFPHYPITLLW